MLKFDSELFREFFESKPEINKVRFARDVLGINPASLYRYINGESNPPAETLANLCEYFRLPLNYFFKSKT